MNTFTAAAVHARATAHPARVAAALAAARRPVEGTTTETNAFRDRVQEPASAWNPDDVWGSVLTPR